MNKTKIKSRFLLFFTTLALAFGFSASLKQKDINKVKALPIPAETKLYLKPNANWLQAGARFAVHFFTAGVGNEWKDMVAEPGVLDIYSVVSPTTAYEKLIFTRMNPAESLNDWANKWNQTGDLVYDGTNNLFTVPADVWDGATTTWSIYNAADHPIPPANPISGGQETYVTVTTTFMGAADHLAGYYFNGTENAWVNGVLVTPRVYKVTAPTPTVPTDKWDKVIFVAMPTAVNDWTPTVIDQTADLLWDGTSDHYDIATSAWGTYVPRTHVVPTATTEGIDRSKVRLWLNRGGHYDSGAHQYVLKVGATYYAASGYTKALVFGTDGIYFPFFDLPSATLNGASVDVVVLDDVGYLVTTIATVPYVTGDNNKLWQVDLVGEALVVNKGGLVGRIYAGFFAKVLEGYLTCDANNENGYMAFGDIDGNFLPRVAEGESVVWNMEGSLGGILIADYVNEADYLTGTREAVAATDAYAKYERMRTLFLGNGGTLGTATERVNQTINPTNNMFVLLSAMFGFALIGIFVYKKKKA